MKIAILLTGQPRSYLFNHLIMKKIVYDHFDKDSFDFFISANLDNKLQCSNANSTEDNSVSDIETLKKLYNPKGIFFSSGYDFKELEELNEHAKNIKQYDTPQKLYDYHLILKHLAAPFSKSEKFTASNFDFTAFKLFFEQYYYVYQAHLLLQNYVKQNPEVKYDYVMRLRFDQIIYSSSTFQILDSILERRNNAWVSSSKNFEAIASLSLPQNFSAIKFPKFARNEIAIFGHSGIVSPWDYLLANDQSWLSDKPKSDYVWVNDQFWISNYQNSIILAEFFPSLKDIFIECTKVFFPLKGCGIEYAWTMFLLRNGIKLLTSFETDIHGDVIRS